MGKPCKFCEIAATVPYWAKPHAGGHVVSFRPFGNVNEGHRLFIPSIHLSGAGEDPYTTGLVFAEAARWGGEKGEAFNLVVNSGKLAGQSVFHLHVHYVPRVIGDGLGYRWNGQPVSGADERG